MRVHTLPARQTTIALPRISRPLAAWLAVNLADAVLTYVLLGLGGLEGNPALARLQEAFGAVGMLSVKLAIATAVGVLLVRRGRERLLTVASPLMGAVAVYNTIVLAFYLAPSMGMPFTY